MLNATAHANEPARESNSPGVDPAITVDVVWYRLNVAPPVIEDARRLLSPAERTRADRFVAPRDWHRSILTRAMLRRLLGARLGLPPTSVGLDETDHGKPILAGRHRDNTLQFNVSHAGDYAAFAFAACRVGIDIETIATRVDRDSIARDFFSTSEFAAYDALAPHGRAQAFMACWTRKEAFIKAIGTGFSYPLQSFSVSLTPGEPARVIAIDGAHEIPGKWTMQSFTPAPGYIASVAVNSGAAHFRPAAAFW